MFTRTLGRSGIKVSALGLGCWAIGGPYNNEQGQACGWGQINDEESLQALNRAVDLGINFLDTAACYGAGHSEEVIGQMLAGRRDKVVIATKFWHVFDEKTRTVTGNNQKVEDIRDNLEGSLRRLQTDRIDLYQFHQGNFPAEQAGEVRDFLERLVEEGKILWYGWSTDDPDRAAVFAKGPHCTAIQQRLSVFEGNADTLALCERENLASINRGPLIKGLLTGKFNQDSEFPPDDIRSVWWNLRGGQEGHWLRKFERIRGIMTSDGRTLAQAALGYIWARSDVTVPIPGFKSTEQVEENVAALQFGPLPQDVMDEIHRLIFEEV